MFKRFGVIYYDDFGPLLDREMKSMTLKGARRKSLRYVKKVEEITKRKVKHIEFYYKDQVYYV